MKIYKQIIIFNKMLTNFVVFVIVPIILFILITSRTSYLFNIRSFDVLTGSMEPIVHTGSMIFTLPQKNYQVGDIITFNRGFITVTHRIVTINGDVFQTKGDANKTVDPQQLYKYNIIGKDIIIIPYLGKATGLVKTPIGFILIMGIPTLIFILIEILEIKKEIEKATEERVRKQIETQYKTRYETTTV